MRFAAIGSRGETGEANGEPAEYEERLIPNKTQRFPGQGV